MKKIISLISILIFSVLLINLVSAKLDWTVPTNGEVNKDFTIQLFGDSLYAPEIVIPNGFQIVLDKSNGKLISGVYRTYYTSNLEITLRPKIPGNYTFTGKYTQGSGVQTLSDKNIQIINPTTANTIICPICPVSEDWSECILEKQKRNTYTCSSETNYTCKSTEETRNCPTNTNTNTGNNQGTEEKTNIISGFFKSIGDFFKAIIDFFTFWK